MASHQSEPIHYYIQYTHTNTMIPNQNQLMRIAGVVGIGLSLLVILQENGII